MGLTWSKANEQDGDDGSRTATGAPPPPPPASAPSNEDTRATVPSHTRTSGRVKSLPVKMKDYHCAGKEGDQKEEPATIPGQKPTSKKRAAPKEQFPIGVAEPPKKKAPRSRRKQVPEEAPRARAWSDLYAELAAFHEKHGHCRVTCSENRKLRDFCYRQKLRFHGKSGRPMTTEEIDKLALLDFDFT